MMIRVDTCTRFDMNHIISFVRELSVGSETTVKRIIRSYGRRFRFHHFHLTFLCTEDMTTAGDCPRPKTP